MAVVCGFLLSQQKTLILRWSALQNGVKLRVCAIFTVTKWNKSTIACP